MMMILGSCLPRLSCDVKTVRGSGLARQRLRMLPTRGRREGIYPSVSFVLEKMFVLQEESITKTCLDFVSQILIHLFIYLFIKSEDQPTVSGPI